MKKDKKRLEKDYITIRGNRIFIEWDFNDPKYIKWSKKIKKWSDDLLKSK